MSKRKTKVQQCALYPEVNNEPSELYKDLLSIENDRPFVNLIYSAYLLPGVAEQMKRLGYKSLNKQGQHRAKDVAAFFGTTTMRNRVGKISDIEIKLGTRDQNGRLVDFATAKEALELAVKANEETAGAKLAGTVSYVVGHNDVFNVVTEARTSTTQLRALKAIRKLDSWEIIEQAFSNINVDINSFDFYKSLINANRGAEFIRWLSSIQQTRNDVFSQQEIQMLLKMDESSSGVERLKKMFKGTLEEVATKIYEALRGAKGYTKAQLDLMNATLDNCKKLQGLDLNMLLQDIRDAEDYVDQNNEESQIQDIINDLDLKYNINAEIILRRLNDPINTLHDAISEAIVTLQRQLRKIKQQQGVTPQVKELRNKVFELQKSIENKKYVRGSLKFLSSAIEQMNYINERLEDAYNASGTTMEKVAAKSGAFLEIKEIVDGYKPIIDALSSIDTLTLTTTLDQADIDNIKNQAKPIKEKFEEFLKIIENAQEGTMIDIATEYIGEADENGTSIATIVHMAKQDSSIYDYFYSANRVSNPILSTMGGILREAQNERTKILSDIAIDIRRADFKLKQAGIKNTEFIYDEDGNIVSDIDWVSYEKAKADEYSRLKKSGLKGLDLIEAMEQWVEDNTEDRIVDFKNNRTEAIPDSKFRKPFKLTGAEKEYYDTMMQIKGEIGTLLPKYAQFHYRPPQIRRSFIDAIRHAKGVKDIARALLNKYKDLYTLREDDPLNTAANVSFDGEDYTLDIGGLDNTIQKQIPIFYINKLKSEDAGELLKDFSGALQSLAATAVNYACMNQVRATVEYMGDFLKSRELAETGDKLEQVITKGVAIYKEIRKKSKATNTQALVDGFIDQLLYGETLQKVNKYTKLYQSILRYSSIRSLSVNLKGMISNYLVGELNILIEAGAGEFFNSVDYMWAWKQLFGDNSKKHVGEMIDLFRYSGNNEVSLASLLQQKFDPMQEVFNELGHTRYFNGPLRRMVSKDLTFVGYGMGEHLIHTVIMYSILHHIKVKIDGNKSNLYKAFYLGEKIDGNRELLLHNNVTYEDENGNWVPVDEAFLNKVKEQIRYANQTCHGSMNTADKGIIHQRMMGRFVMHLRQWMIESYSKRYRKKYFDSGLKQWREGYYRTTGRFFKSWAKAISHFNMEYAIHRSDMTKEQKANVKRAMREQAIIAILMGFSWLIGGPEDHKKEWLTRAIIYQIQRSLLDLGALVPVSANGPGVVNELPKLINNPIASTSTINSTLYPILGYKDLVKWEKVKKGPYKDWPVYFKNVLNYSVPFYRQIMQTIHMDEDEALFNYMKKSLY